VDKQRCVSGVSSDFRCCIAPTTQDGSVSFSNAHHYFIDSIVLIVHLDFVSLQNIFTTLLQLAFLSLFSDVTLFLQISWCIGEFKHKSSHRNSERCISGAHKIIPEIAEPQPSVMAELHDFDGASRVLVDSMSCLRHNKISISKELLHERSNVSGLLAHPRYRLISSCNSVKNPPTVKSCSSIKHQLVGSAERSASTKMGSASANSSLSEKMPLLRQPQNGGTYQSRSRISALNQRHKIVNSKEEINMLSKEKVHEQSDFSLGIHSTAILNNALVRQNQLCSSEPLNQQTPEVLWSCTCSSTCSDNIDDFHVSSSCDTSDNSTFSSLGVIAKDEWKMAFKKVLPPSPNICRFDFFTPTLIIHLIKKIKVMKKSNIYLNYIM
jgi:hypothetical protein